MDEPLCGAEGTWAKPPSSLSETPTPLIFPLKQQVPLITTVAAAKATYEAIKFMRHSHLEMIPLQEFLPEFSAAAAKK